MPEFKNLTGKKFGALTVLRRTDDYISPTGKKTVVWHCRCDCGNELDVLRPHLTDHSSCPDCAAARHSKRLSIDLTGQRYGKLVVLERVESSGKYKHSHAWKCRCDCGNEIIAAAKGLRNNAAISCGCVHDKEAGERISTDGANILGRYNGTMVTQLAAQKPRSTNTSGCPGVSYMPACGKWRARIMVRGKEISLGRYEHYEDAVAARKRGEQMYHLPIIETYEAAKPNPSGQPLAEYAAAHRISLADARRMCRKGLIPGAVKVGGIWIISSPESKL